MKKAIFGGTFDPIHIGHIHIAYEALYSLKLDKILFMPAGNPPNKLNKQITDSKIRYDLVNKAIEGEINFEISDYEINKKENSYTYETIELFSKLQSNTEWYFLIGADSLIDLDNWKNVDRLLNGCRLVVYNRAGFALEKILEQKKSLESKYHNKIIFLDMPIIDISSTSIRESIKEGRNINYLLPKGVEKIVEKLKLYR
ncbi:nicotinate-nucleotide adenylyltransferase [Clostridium estertheticum]|uniref:nicotinate-nucleotide adenylyltransferase n=1 Tax=Clostridium estertheticum TaxID=238834 RepID=UPI001C0D6C84|nr:nicotinate-nucleotide adenylyltransferase [Clostridium estertheticum]MBU3072995.1 nicotinate-nucleotide adenylyltransferase [Clostridium estertheticum]MBU3162968.1 nicotinate-nucleotide adenylyltransferase [Clostridium estertheticum]MBU3172805.1 nicotinate-nucleotide adenylyltransferase [Clostridium estertheticum]MBU3183704.1 nicotinate-nucleotide adenylyltransferase [Clostridium estertheticum]